MVEGQREIDLFGGTELLIRIRRERVQGERPVHTRRIVRAVDVLMHRQLIDADNTPAHLNLAGQRIERPAAHAPVFRRERHIGDGTVRRSADVRRDRRRARHGLIDARQPRKEPESHIVRRDIDIHHAVKIHRPRRGERAVALLSRKTVNRQHMVGE